MLCKYYRAGDLIRNQSCFAINISRMYIKELHLSLATNYFQLAGSLTIEYIYRIATLGTLKAKYIAENDNCARLRIKKMEMDYEKSNLKVLAKFFKMRRSYIAHILMIINQTFPRT